jgi:hypothetical protein
MLTIVDIATPNGDLLHLPLEDVSNGYAIADIEGLDPVKATIVSSSFANQDGEQYHSARREARNIIFTIDLEPDYTTQTVRQLRSQLYQYFMPKSVVDLTFHMDDPTLDVTIQGRVESFETPLFTKDPQVAVSVMCFDPDFIDPTEVSLSGDTVSDTTETLISYPGTVETGIDLVVNVDRVETDLTIYHRKPDGSIVTLEFAADLIAGDTVEISTVPGAKGAWLTRSGTKSSLLYGISPQSNWIALEPGDNYIRVYTTGAAIPYVLDYTVKYGAL